MPRLFTLCAFGVEGETKYSERPTATSSRDLLVLRFVTEDSTKILERSRRESRKHLPLASPSAFSMVCRAIVPATSAYLDIDMVIGLT
jgi:hypothetical protein